MSKRLALTERQVTALCRGAAKAGCAPIVQIGDVFVRLVPEELAVPPRDSRKLDDEEEIRL